MMPGTMKNKTMVDPYRDARIVAQQRTLRMSIIHVFVNVVAALGRV
jgi:hypothetical protein